MDDLYQQQLDIAEAINKLLINYKKDGPSRKDKEYFERRLSELNSFWEKFEQIHAELYQLYDARHPYFASALYNKTKALVQSVETIIKGDYNQYILLNTSWAEENAGEEPPQPEPTTSAATQETKRTQNLQSVPMVSTITKNQGSPSKYDDMMKKQSINFRAFIRTVNNINLANINDKWEFEDALKSLQTRWSIIDNYHWEIAAENEALDMGYEDLFTKHEKIFNDLKKSINTKLWSVQHRDKTTPQMEIPIFTGDFQSWLSFKDLFTEVIHSNPSLSAAQKMQFLKGKIKGEPEKLIQHLQISSENYVISWSILNNRYDNKKQIFSSHMDAIMRLPTLNQQSSISIKRMHDTSVECLNAIKNLGVNIDTWDPIIIHILSNKLDSDSHNDYIESLKNSKELPILKEFLDFLETKFTCLEASRRKTETSLPRQYQSPNYQQSTSSYRKNYQPVYKTNNYSNKYHNQATSNTKLSFATSGSVKCPLCNHDHALYTCKNFLEMNNELKLKTIAKLEVCKNCLYCHYGKACISTKKCRQCQEYHNTILHDAFAKPKQVPTKAYSNMQSKSNAANASTHVTQSECSDVLLSTALIKVKGADQSYHVMRAFIDQGSQVSIITERAAQILGLRRRHCSGVIVGVGHKENQCKGLLDLTCLSLYNDFTFISEVLIMSNLVKNLPNHTFIKPQLSYLENINLADPQYNISRPIDLLLGADIYSTIILSGIIKGENESEPLAQQSQLGWLLCGNVKSSYQCNVIINNMQDMRKFWEVEEVNDESELSSEDQGCIEHYLSTTKRQQDGRYEVEIPFIKNGLEKLGSSKEIAIAQFKNVEKKFIKQQNLSEQYKSFMAEYLNMGHMCISNNIKDGCYLPHHAVLRDDSITTKLRVVFNASARTSTGISLNDVMCKGPNLQQDLHSLILSWRQYKYAFTSDIEKMFRQINISKHHQIYQKIIWRESANEALQTYQLSTVTYGTKSAPFLAMMTLKKLAQDEKDQYPLASKILEQSFYMDDLVHGAHTLESANQIIKDLISLLQSGGFHLRKWIANCPEIIQNISIQEQQSESFTFKSEHISKTLGLHWNAVEDKFILHCQISKYIPKLTKRTLLAEISKMFDPLGWLAPITTKLKLLFQKVWSEQIKWDDQVSSEIRNEWLNITANLHQISHLQIPRWLGNTEKDIIELHAFSDASIKCYAAVIYARVRKQNHYNIVLLSSKTRIVPTNKNTSLPRLELCGALLLAQLLKKVSSCYPEHTLKTYAWCDSKVVLAWLQGDHGRWKTYVSNRAKLITSIISAEHWRYVKSEENPADCASRGLFATQLKQHKIWWQGPDWLKTFEYQNQDNKQAYSTNEEIKNKISLTNIIHRADSSIIKNLLEQHSDINKIKRIIAWILRAFKQLFSKVPKHLPSYLTLAELEQANMILIKHEQRVHFGTDIDIIRKSNKLSSSSTLRNLNPLLSSGVLRVGGRLKNANISSDMKYPIIIPKESNLANLIINQAHHITYHGGARLTLSFLRQKYWIIGGTSTVKKHIRKCIICAKQNAKSNYQLMGDLPSSRVNPSKPFEHTAVDYTGSVEVKCNQGRGIKTTKGYIAIFVCMATKAVHIELVSDMTSSAFLSALRRMAARRGAPSHIYSDNGTNFVKADRVIQESLTESFFKDITDMKITWHRNAPSWPQAGGLWERAVRSLKYHLKRVLNNQKLTFEEYSTLLAQIESCLNSRPLCPLTEDIEDLDFLTPSHFLISRPGLSIIETAEDARTRWYHINQIFRDLWRRWKSEYLTQLSVRNKWLERRKNIEKGNLVVIHEDNLPANKWLMGRVTEVHPGSDGLVRVVTLKTKNGYLTRPVVKLSVLPLKTEERKYQEKEEDTKQNKKQSNAIIDQKSISLYQTNFLSKAFYIILFIMTLFSTSNASLQISNLKPYQSIYFDPISKMQLTKDKWTLVVYYSMSPYWEGEAAFDKIFKHLNSICMKIESPTECEMIIMQINHNYNELIYYDQLLFTQARDVGGSNLHSRHRRGLINGVGYIANSLFGVLDERFAEQYSKDIELVRNNEKHLVDLWRNQTSIIESQYNLLKRIEDNISRQHRAINEHFSTLDHGLISLNQHVKRITQREDFLLSVIAAQNLLSNLKQIQDTILDTITDINQGQFSLHLLSPEQLKNELNIISGQISKELSLPIDNIETDLSKIYKLLKIKSSMTRRHLLFELSFPLISRDNYEIYKLIPVPHKVENHVMEIVTKTEYLAINLRKDKYLTLSIDELQQCIENKEYHLCMLQKPIYHLNAEEKFCVLDTNERCKMKRSVCENQWIPLSSTTKYLYFVCTSTSLMVLCENEPISRMNINQTGIISLEDNCEIKGKDFTLITHEYPHKLNTMNVRPSIIIPVISDINNVFNLSIPEYREHTEAEIKINNSLSSLGEEIKQMKNADVNLNEISTHDIHQYSIIYGLVVAALLAVGAWWWRKCRLRRLQITNNAAAAGRSDIIELKVCESVRREVESDQVLTSVPKIKQNVATSPIVKKRSEIVFN